ncbi:MAG: hypothetical protein ACC652_15860 [Acidimicrobiales bacterium]
MVKKLIGAVTTTGLLAGGVALALVSPSAASAAGHQTIDTPGANATAEGHGPEMRRRARPNLDTLSEVLGVDSQTLGEALKGGQTIADIAAENNVSLDTVKQAMLDEQAARIASALEEGKIDQEQADARTERLTENIDGIINGEIKPGRGGMGRGGMRQEQRQKNLDEMAELLGVDAQDLADSLKSGSSLTEIAEENGVDTEVIVDAIVDRQTKRLNNAVENGRISEERAAELAENSEERATAVANGERRPGRRRGGAPAQAPSN